MLLGRQRLPVDEGVRRVMALQAQEAVSPYLALWNRLGPFDPGALDRAFAEGSVVKASLMRITLHAVHRDDHPVFRAAMAWSLRASRVNDRRFGAAGLQPADADSALPALLAFTDRPRTRLEMEAYLDSRRPGTGPGLVWALRTFAPLIHAPTGGPWSFGPRATYVTAPAPDPPPDPDVAVRSLVCRYLEAFGPASVLDLAQFTRLRRGVVRAAIEALGGDVVALVGADGPELFDIPDGLLPEEDTPAPPRLMAMWDSVLLAYADRSRLIPPEYRRAVIRSNGDVLPTLLVDGAVAGVWRPVTGGIEATAFHRLGSEVWQGLEGEATALVAFLAERQAAVYGRYTRWWSGMPAAEVRIIGGS